jgi:hypothetical protein
MRLCSSDASCGHCVAGYPFIGIIGSLFWLLVHYFLLPGGLHTASRISYMSCWMWDSCIVISSIALEVVAVSGEGGVDMAIFSSSFFVRVSTADFNTAVSSLEVR